MKRFKVEWSPIAQKDLKSVISHISEDNPLIALKRLKMIRQKAASLYLFPQRGRIIPELRHLPELSFRELIISPWRLIYRIQESGKNKRIDILAFFDGRRDLEEVLFERISRFR